MSNWRIGELGASFRSWVSELVSRAPATTAPTTTVTAEKCDDTFEPAQANARFQGSLTDVENLKSYYEKSQCYVEASNACFKKLIAPNAALSDNQRRVLLTKAMDLREKAIEICKSIAKSPLQEDVVYDAMARVGDLYYVHANVIRLYPEYQHEIYQENHYLNLSLQAYQAARARFSDARAPMAGVANALFRIEANKNSNDTTQWRLIASTYDSFIDYDRHGRIRLDDSDPGQNDELIRAGYAHLRAGNFDKAAGYYNRALLRHEREDKAVVLEGAQACLKAGDFKNAARYFATVEPETLQRSGLLLEAADACFSAGDYTNAVTFYKQALPTLSEKKGEEKYQPYLRLALSHYFTGDYKAATRAFIATSQNAGHLKPEDAPFAAKAIYFMGQQSTKTDQFKKQLETLDLGEGYTQTLAFLEDPNKMPNSSGQEFEDRELKPIIQLSETIIINDSGPTSTPAKKQKLRLALRDLKSIRDSHKDESDYQRNFKKQVDGLIQRAEGMLAS